MKKNLATIDYEAILSSHGIVYKGLMENAEGKAGLVLFDNKYGGTLAIKIENFTVEAVKLKIQNSEKNWY